MRSDDWTTSTAPRDARIDAIIIDLEIPNKIDHLISRNAFFNRTIGRQKTDSEAGTVLTSPWSNTARSDNGHDLGRGQVVQQIRGHAEPDPAVYVPSPREPRARPSSSASDYSQVSAEEFGHDRGFAFSAEELERIRAGWDGLFESYGSALGQAAVLIEVNRGPGNEYASENNAKLIKSFGEKLVAALEERARHCSRMTELLRETLGSYAVTEHDATERVTHEGGMFE